MFGEERRLCDHIVRVTVLLKWWLLQIEQGFYMETKDKKHPGIKRIGKKASYPFGFMVNCLLHLQQFDRKSRESCLAQWYLQFIPLDSMQQQWRSLPKWRSFKHAGNLLNSLKSLQIILEEQWKSTCQASYWRSKVMVLHSSTND